MILYIKIYYQMTENLFSLKYRIMFHIMFHYLIMINGLKIHSQ